MSERQTITLHEQILRGLTTTQTVEVEETETQLDAALRLAQRKPDIDLSEPGFMDAFDQEYIEVILPDDTAFKGERKKVIKLIEDARGQQ